MSPTLHHARTSVSNIGHVLNRLANSSPARVAHDLARAARLLRRDPVPRPALTRRERLVVTLTTVPDRAPYLRPALRSLLDQTCPADRILLAWPDHSRRSGAPYPPPPPLPAAVDVLRCADEGPATKFLPAARAEQDAVIVVVDDDAMYPDTFLEDLLHAHRRTPQAAVGLRGQRVRIGLDPRYRGHVYGTAVHTPIQVDVLMGMWGYLIPPRALDDAVHDFAGWPPELRWQDDVWISGHLARRRVPRFVVPVRGVPIESRAAFVGALHHTVNRSGHNEAVAINAFREWWQA